MTLRIYPYTVTKLFCSSCGTFRELAGTVPQRLIDLYIERHRGQHVSYFDVVRSMTNDPDVHDAINRVKQRYGGGVYGGGNRARKEVGDP